MEQIGFFIGLGVVIVFIAALALGRLAVVGVRDAKLAESKAAADAVAAEEAGRETAAPPAAAVPSRPAEPARDGARLAPGATEPGPADRTLAGSRTDLTGRAEPADAADDAARQPASSTPA